MQKSAERNTSRVFRMFKLPDRTGRFEHFYHHVGVAV